MPISMTRSEYQAKYGQPPPTSTTPKAGPIRMTHAEYMAKYGQQQGGGFLGGVKDFFTSRLPEVYTGTDKVGAARLGAKQGFEVATGFLSPESGATELSKPLTKLAPKVLTGIEEKVGEILKPTTKTLKSLTKKIAPEFVEKAPFFLTLEGLVSKVESKVSQFGRAIGEKFNLLPPEGKDALSPILKRITKAQDNLAIKGTSVIPMVNQAEYQALNNLKIELVDIAKNTQEIPTSSLRSYLQELDKSIEKTGKGFGLSLADSSALAARKTMANSIRDEMAKSRPDIAVLNKEFTFWKRVEKIGKATLERKTGQAGGLRAPISGAGGAVAGATVGAATGIPGATEVLSFVGSLVGNQLQKIFDSAGYARISLGARKKAADFIASGKLDDAVKILEQGLIKVRTSK